jgi:hypothetical protein
MRMEWYWDEPEIEVPDVLPTTVPESLNAAITSAMSDDILQPSHYNLRTPATDCWDVMEQTGIVNDHFVASAFQYLWRCNLKGQYVKDLRKAIAYLNKAVTRYEALDTDDK